MVGVSVVGLLWNGMRVGYSCVAIMASVGVMVVEIGWQGKKQEEL